MRNMDKFFCFVWIIVGVFVLESVVIHGDFCDCNVIREAVSKEIFDLKIDNIRLTSRMETIESMLLKKEAAASSLTNKVSDLARRQVPVCNIDADTDASEQKPALVESEIEDTDKWTDPVALNTLLVKALRAEKFERLRLERKIEEGLGLINTSFKEIDEHIKTNFESHVNNISRNMEEFKKQSVENDANFRNDIMNVAKRLENQTNELLNGRTEVETDIRGINKTVSRMAADISSVVDIVLLDQKAVCEPICTNGGVCFNDGSCRCKQFTEGSHCERFICEDKCFENDGECVGPGLCKCPSGQQGYNCEHEIKSDCYEILRTQGHPKSGIYRVVMQKSEVPVEVICDMETDGGGWTIFQNRYDGSIDFYRNFSDYVNGFGNITGEFWLGLENIHRLVSSGPSELRIDVSKVDGTTGYEIFPNFDISASPDYALSISLGGTGTIGDSTSDGLSFNNGCLFSTFDNDRDSYSGNCAENNKGGWWYCRCMEVNLNGQYCTPKADCGYEGMIYYRFAELESLKTSRMMLRRLPTDT